MSSCNWVNVKFVALQAVGTICCAVGFACPNVRDVTTFSTLVTTFVTTLLWCMSFNGTVIKKTVQLLQLGTTIAAAMLASVALNEEDEGLADDCAIMSCVSYVVSMFVTSLLYVMSRFARASQMEQKKKQQFQLSKEYNACLNVLNFCRSFTQNNLRARFNYKIVCVKFTKLQYELRIVHGMEGCLNGQQLDSLRNAEKEFLSEVMVFLSFYRSKLSISEYGIIIRMLGAVEREILGLEALIR